MTNTKTNTKARARRSSPKKSKSQQLHFNLFDWLMLAAAVIASAITLYVSDSNPLYLAASIVTLISGVFYIILGAKGLRSNFIFCIINTLAVIFIAWANQFYGNLAINLLFYLPCSFIGYYLWGQNSRKNHEVVARKFTTQQAIIIAIILVAGTAGLKFALDALGGASTLLDSIATVSAVIANILVLLRYREQWLIWLISDTAQIILWGTTGDPAICTLRVLYIVGSVYGYINWRKLVKTPRQRKNKTKN